MKAPKRKPNPLEHLNKVANKNPLMKREQKLVDRKKNSMGKRKAK
jgi:hypothetical protein